MKRACRRVLLIMCVFLLASCSRLSRAPKLPTLEEAIELSGEELFQMLEGVQRNEMIAAWGEPNYTNLNNGYTFDDWRITGKLTEVQLIWRQSGELSNARVYVPQYDTTDDSASD